MRGGLGNRTKVRATRRAAIQKKPRAARTTPTRRQQQEQDRFLGKELESQTVKTHARYSDFKNTARLVSMDGFEVAINHRSAEGQFDGITKPMELGVRIPPGHKHPWAEAPINGAEKPFPRPGQVLILHASRSIKNKSLDPPPILATFTVELVHHDDGVVSSCEVSGRLGAIHDAHAWTKFTETSKLPEM